MALDGPSLSKNMKLWNEEYRKVVVASVKNGARPTHYATGENDYINNILMNRQQDKWR